MDKEYRQLAENCRKLILSKDNATQILGLQINEVYNYFPVCRRFYRKYTKRGKKFWATTELRMLKVRAVLSSELHSDIANLRVMPKEYYVSDMIRRLYEGIALFVYHEKDSYLGVDESYTDLNWDLYDVKHHHIRHPKYSTLLDSYRLRLDGIKANRKAQG